MDTIIEKKKGWRVAFTRKAVPFWLGGIFVLFCIYLLTRDNSKTLRVDSDTVTVSEVKFAEFKDYIRVNGQVQPLVTIQLSPVEGGNVDKILIEEGSRVKAGDAILVLSNENLDLQILNAEAELAEKENILRNTMISMEQQKLSHEQNRLQYESETKRNKRTYEQNEQLYKDHLISKEDYLRAQEDYELSARNLELTLRSMEQDSMYRTTEIERLQESLDNMRLNMQLIRRRKESLVIKAPIDGVLGLLDATLGQYIPAGTKIGQINSEGNFKIEAKIDEHYIDRVVPGLDATFERQNDRFDAQVRKVYPEVREGKFQADFKFIGQQPENIRSGQTYYLSLQLGQSEEAVLVPRGTFYQKTGGKWIYVLSPDGKKATRREIRIGRQNPQYYEVLEGLEAGERVITSSYDNFGDAEVLVF